VKKRDVDGRGCLFLIYQTHLQMKHLFFYFLATITTLEANSQRIEVDKTVVIGGYNQTYFYSGRVNCFGVIASRDPFNTFVFKTTQGKLELRDSAIADGNLNPDFAIGPYYNSQLLQIQPFA
jgi:hypothetical protein